MKQISLYFKEGTSDKVYHIQLVKEGSGYVVNYQHGKRCGTLQTGTKTESPVSLEQAEKIYSSLLKSKLHKGYHEGETQNNFSLGTQVESPVPLEIPQLLNMIENPEYYINNDEWLAQEKKDGERRLINENKQGFNKLGKNVVLPDSILNSYTGNNKIDGEIIGDILFAFDLKIKNIFCEDRIQMLDKMSFGSSIQKVYTAYTKEEKKALFEKLQAEHKEGIVFKRKKSYYAEGRPASGGDQVKFKFYKTATFIVSKITKGKRSVSLELLDDMNNRVDVGKVTIPPNKEIPCVNDLIEVRYLYAYKGGAIFQSTYIEKRSDVLPEEALLSQLIYKSEEK